VPTGSIVRPVWPSPVDIWWLTSGVCSDRIWLRLLGRPVGQRLHSDIRILPLTSPRNPIIISKRECWSLKVVFSGPSSIAITPMLISTLSSGRERASVPQSIRWSVWQPLGDRPTSCTPNFYRSWGISHIPGPIVRLLNRRSVRQLVLGQWPIRLGWGSPVDLV